MWAKILAQKIKIGCYRLQKEEKHLVIKIDRPQDK